MLEKRRYNGQQDIHLYRAKKGLQDQHCKPPPPPPPTPNNPPLRKIPPTTLLVSPT